VLEEITRFTTPAFRSSIMTYAPGLPVEVHVNVCVVPRTQLSPPFGEVTVNAPAVMAKLVLLESVMAALVVLVILIL
jgi:hypothetical protein